ncbi:uncharacterized protein LOC106525212, partial [Austrofundulus limnaeus]|uniref:Uncharacterized protein LOC106525212 n=1 Tax=Austrofundulus limnaeus TaxID=52670 RepID=A0A2I4C4B6_AUSLI
MSGQSKQNTLASCWAPSLGEVLPMVARRRRSRQLASIAEQKASIKNSASVHKTSIESSASSSVNPSEGEQEMDSVHKTSIESSASSSVNPSEGEQEMDERPSSSSVQKRHCRHTRQRSSADTGEEELEMDGPPARLEELECDCGMNKSHDVDSLGWVTSALVDSVKTAVLHLLNISLRNYLEEICNGCRISHPSQRQHRCLMVKKEEYFFRNNFSSILQRLLTPQFVPAIQKLLSSRNIQAP